MNSNDTIQPESTKKRVLIIDDIRTDLHLLGKLVTGFGHETILAESAIQALDLINESIDLVIVDAIMPGIDGFTFVKKMRDIDSINIPTIMITSLSGREDRIRAVEAGVNDFVSKPVDKVELRVRINSMLKIKAAQDKVLHYQKGLEELVEQKTSDLSLTLSKMNAILNSVNVSMVLINNNSVINAVNQAFLDLAKLNKPDDAIGCDFFSLLTTPQQQNTLNELLDHKSTTYERDIEFPQWGNKVFSVTSTPVENDSHVLVMRDITEKIQADEQRAQLLSLLSHELRTPLNCIKGLAAIINEDKELLTEEHIDYFESIQDCGNQLEIIVNELLNFIQLVNNTEEFQEKNIALLPVIKKIVNNLSCEQVSGNLSIDTQIEGDNPLLFCKEMHIEEIVKQIVSNAIRFSTENSQIDIKLIQGVNSIKFICTDTGIGISKENLTKVFDSFYQIENYLTRTKDGLGLGLTIAKRIVKLYKGNISIKSVENKGTTVTVTFPAS